MEKKQIKKARIITLATLLAMSISTLIWVKTDKTNDVLVITKEKEQEVWLLGIAITGVTMAMAAEMLEKTEEKRKREPFKKGDLVWVKDSYEINWNVRFFKEKKGGRYICYHQNGSESPLSTWEQCRSFFEIPFENMNKKTGFLK
jgi:hypothetical protein